MCVEARVQPGISGPNIKIHQTKRMANQSDLNRNEEVQSSLRQPFNLFSRQHPRFLSTFSIPWFEKIAYVLQQPSQRQMAQKNFLCMTKNATFNNWVLHKISLHLFYYFSQSFLTSWNLVFFFLCIGKIQFGRKILVLFEKRILSEI